LGGGCLPGLESNSPFFTAHFPPPPISSSDASSLPFFSQDSRSAALRRWSSYFKGEEDCLFLVFSPRLVSREPSPSPRPLLPLPRHPLTTTLWKNGAFSWVSFSVSPPTDRRALFFFKRGPSPLPDFLKEISPAACQPAHLFPYSKKTEPPCLIDIFPFSLSSFLCPRRLRCLSLRDGPLSVLDLDGFSSTLPPTLRTSLLFPPF